MGRLSADLAEKHEPRAATPKAGQLNDRERRSCDQLSLLDGARDREADVDEVERDVRCAPWD